MSMAVPSSFGGSSKLLSKNRAETSVYVFFSMCLVCIAKWFSDCVFSVLITLGAAFQCLGFMMLFVKVFKKRGVEGVSLRSLYLYTGALCCRLFSTLRYKGYLPVDRTGDFVYQMFDVIALATVLCLIYKMKLAQKKDPSLAEDDTCRFDVLGAGAFALACFIHPHLNNRTIPDIAWTAGLYIETIAMVPQLFMMTKQANRGSGEVEALQGHYIACVFVARLCMMRFWITCYTELKPKTSDINLPGFTVMGTQLLQCVIFSDFMYLYVKSIRNNTKLILPTSFEV